MERSRPGVRKATRRGAPRTVQEAALRLLRRRPRTRAELEQELARLEYTSAEIDETLNGLARAGYVNDDELARHYLTTRAARLGHGRERLFADLERRGVGRESAERAWNDALESGEIDPRELLRKAVRRRTRGVGRLDANGQARVYNALLRAGYDAEEIRRELEPHLADVPFDMPQDEEIHDDFE